MFASDALYEFQHSKSQARHAGKTQFTNIFSPPENEPVKSRPYAGQAQHSSVFSDEDILTKPQGIHISGAGSAHAGHLSSDFAPQEEAKHFRPYAGQAQHSSVFSDEGIPTRAQGIRVSGDGSVAGHLSSDLCPPEEFKSPRPHAGQAQRSTVFSDEAAEVRQGIRRNESANKSSFGDGFALEGDSYFQRRSRSSLSGSMSGKLGADLAPSAEEAKIRVSPHAGKMTQSHEHLIFSPVR